MTHDPLCVQPQVDYPCKRCWEIDCECLCICDIIAKVREDVVNRFVGAAQVHWDAGYAFGVDEGQRDMLARLTSEEAHAVIVKVLNDEGAMSEGGWHGWRCFDKGRYPDPCRCTECVVDEVLSALSALQEKT